MVKTYAPLETTLVQISDRATFILVRLLELLGSASQNIWSFGFNVWLYQAPPPSSIKVINYSQCFVNSHYFTAGLAPPLLAWLEGNENLHLALFPNAPYLIQTCTISFCTNMIKINDV